MPARSEVDDLSRRERQRVLRAFRDAAITRGDDAEPAKKRRRIEKTSAAAEGASHGGGFVVDDDADEVAARSEEDEGDASPVRLPFDRIGAALASLDLEDDADVLDAFRDVTDDKDDTIGEDDFLRVCAVLLSAQEDEVDEAIEPDDDVHDGKTGTAGAGGKARKNSAEPSAGAGSGRGPAKRKRNSKAKAHELTAERQATINKLFAKFTGAGSGRRADTFGVDGVRAMAALVGELKWTETDMQEMINFVTGSSDGGSGIDLKLFTDLVMKTKAV